jgi:hypothetical protein
MSDISQEQSYIEQLERELAEEKEKNVKAQEQIKKLQTANVNLVRYNDARLTQ